MEQPPEGSSGQSPARIVAEKQAAYVASTTRALGIVLRVQTLVAILLALGLWVIGPVAAYSSLCGSLAVYLPGLMFTVLVGRKIGHGSAGFLGAAAMAEIAKLGLTGLLCALVFIWIKPLAPVWFFVGMLTVLATGWVGLAKAIR
jgi:F0F1-type ATP synthase assembly protein I